MRDVISNFRFNIDEITRLSRETLCLLSGQDSRTSPIRYRDVLNDALRIRTIWDSHVRLSVLAYALIAAREPRLRDWLFQFEAEQQRLAAELKFMTPPRWPRSTEVGLNSLRVRAFAALPALIRELKREELTVLPLFRRWIYGGMMTDAAIIQTEPDGRNHQPASA